MPEQVSHVEVLARRWVQAGASVWLVRPEAGAERPIVEDDRLGQGEILAFRVGDVGLRFWTRRAEAALTDNGGLRLSVKSAGPVLVGEVAIIDLPTVGSAFWVGPPVVWTAWDRRRAFRMPVHTYCQVHLGQGEAASDEPLVRKVVNLSITGAAIEGVPARLGEEVGLILELAPVAPPLELRARVVRQESAAMGAHTALEFRPDEAGQAVLLQYLLAVSARQLVSALRR